MYMSRDLFLPCAGSRDRSVFIAEGCESGSDGCCHTRLGPVRRNQSTRHRSPRRRRTQSQQRAPLAQIGGAGRTRQTEKNHNGSMHRPRQGPPGSSTSCSPSAASRRARRSRSAASSRSLKPPPRPVRGACGIIVPDTKNEHQTSIDSWHGQPHWLRTASTVPGFAALHWLHLSRLAQLMLPH